MAYSGMSTERDCRVSVGNTAAAARRTTYILTRIWPGLGASVANSVIRVEIWPGLSYTTALCVFGISMVRQFDLARGVCEAE